MLRPVAPYPTLARRAVSAEVPIAPRAPATVWSAAVAAAIRGVAGARALSGGDGAGRGRRDGRLVCLDPPAELHRELAQLHTPAETY